MSVVGYNRKMVHVDKKRLREKRQCPNRRVERSWEISKFNVPERYLIKFHVSGKSNVIYAKA